MIQCKKCKAENPPGCEVCKSCGSNLLPGESLGDRLGTLIAAIIASAIGFGLAYISSTLPADLPECLPTSPAAWFFVGIVAMGSGLVAAVRKTPLHERYEQRARRHFELDPEQAITDFTRAFELAPENKRASLLEQRAKLFAKLGKEREATRDRLDYTSTEGAYGTGAGLARMIGADTEAYTSTAAKDERARMVADGKVVALGFCTKCGDVVALTHKLRCPVHPSVKGQAVHHTLPGDLEPTKAKVLEEYNQTRKQRRTWGLACGLGVIISIVLCVAVGIISNLTSDKRLATATATITSITATPTLTAIPPTVTPVTLDPFSDGQVACMLAGPFGLTCLGESGWRTFSDTSLAHWDLKQMAACSDGRIVAGGYGGISIFNGQNWIDHKSGGIDSVSRVVCDASGQIWAAYYGGVDRFDGSEWTTFTGESLGFDEGGGQVNEVAVGPDGRVWVLTEDSLAAFDGGGWQVFRSGEDVGGEYGYDAIAFGTGGRTWVTDGFSLHEYEGDAWMEVEMPGSPMIETLSADAQDRLWVGTYDQGVYVLSSDGWTSYDTTNGSLSSNDILSLAIDGQGRAWVGTRWGLNVLEGGESVSYHMHTSPLLDNVVEAILVLGDGPALVGLQEKPPGSIRGQVVREGQAWAGMPVEICVEVIGHLYFGETPCSGQPYVGRAMTDADGWFTIPDVATGYYNLIVQLSEEEWLDWSDPEGSQGRVWVKPGEERLLHIE